MLYGRQCCSCLSVCVQVQDDSAESKTIKSGKGGSKDAKAAKKAERVSPTQIFWSKMDFVEMMKTAFVMHAMFDTPYGT